MSEKFYFTRRGLERLHEEIKELEEKIQELQAQTAHAAEVGGDQWHDNAAYEQLLVDLRVMDIRLQDAHRTLNRAVPIDPPTEFDRVTIGVRVRMLKDGDEGTWDIVGFGESDPDLKLLAYNTPLASLIIGKQEGEVVRGTIADRETKIEILEITKGEIEDVRGP